MILREKAWRVLWLARVVEFKWDTKFSVQETL
jgi:hypothetical protein